MIIPVAPLFHFLVMEAVCVTGPQETASVQMMSPSKGWNTGVLKHCGHTGPNVLVSAQFAGWDGTVVGYFVLIEIGRAHV